MSGTPSRAAHSIPTLFHLAAKHLGRRRATARLIDLLKLVSVAPQDEETILRGLALGWPDFEDALQMLCADAVGADYLVTRNTRDFEAGAIRVVTPAELLAVLEGPQPDALGRGWPP